MSSIQGCSRTIWPPRFRHRVHAGTCETRDPQLTSPRFASTKDDDETSVLQARPRRGSRSLRVRRHHQQRGVAHCLCQWNGREERSPESVCWDCVCVEHAELERDGEEGVWREFGPRKYWGDREEYTERRHAEERDLQTGSTFYEGFASASPTRGWSVVGTVELAGIAPPEPKHTFPWRAEWGERERTGR